MTDDQNDASTNTDPWEVAKVIGPFFDGVFPLKGKVAFQKEWYRHARRSDEGIRKYAKEWKGYNYAVYLETVFVLDCDVEGLSALKQELVKSNEILGPFVPGFVVVTGRNRYHIYCDAKGREIHSQKLTDNTHIKGWHSYVVGPGSWNVDVENPKQYEICDRDSHNDPRQLTELSDEVLDRLADKRTSFDSDDKDEKKIVTFNIGNGSDVLTLEHPPCVRKLMLKGAPTDQDYVQANHTIARYVISAGLTDGDGAAIASKMATNTSPEHPTGKDTHDKVYNFRSCMSSARTTPENNQFACSYVRGSRELIDNNLCKGCPKEATRMSEVPADQLQRVRAHAYYVLTKGDPYDYFIKTYHHSHARDDAVGKVTLLSVSCQSVLNADGIYPHATGGSGKGKSSGKKSVYHLVPQEYVFKRSFSDQALFYTKLPEEAILFLDDQTMSSGMEELVRGVMDEFQGTKQRTIVHDAKEITLDIPPRCIVTFTNVDSSLNLQTANRTVNVSVDESKEADDDVYELAQRRGKAAAPKYPESFEVLVCREMFRIIKQEIGPFRVSIPYAEFIAFPRKDDRRNPDIFYDFIHGLTALRCMQRSTREGVVFANKKDFDDAAALYNSLSKTQTSKLDDHELAVVQAIFNNNKSAAINNIVELSGLKYGTIRNILKGRPGRPDTGLLDKIPGLTVCNVSDKWQDPNDTGHATSKNTELFELPHGFNIMNIYESAAVELLDGWDKVDINTVKLWTPFTTFTGFYTAFTDVCKSTENYEITSDDEINSIIETYKQQLHNNTTTFTDIPEREAVVSPPTTLRPKHPPEEGEGWALSLTPVKAVKAYKQGDNENKKDQNDDKIENEPHNGEKVLLHMLVKAGYKTNPNRPLVLKALESLHVRKLGTPFDTTHPHTDDEFCWFFEQELMQFKYTDGRKRHGCTTDDDVGVEICKRVCDDRSIHLQDVVQAWGRLSDNKAIVSVLDEIFNRAPRGKADGPKMMES
jgi:Bifunctional DNA primase/polymerase, N-terminal